MILLIYVADSTDASMLVVNFIDYCNLMCIFTSLQAILLEMKNKGMFGRLFLGPLYSQCPKTKQYYIQNGQAFINKGDNGGTLYFMTGLVISILHTILHTSMCSISCRKLY